MRYLPLQHLWIVYPGPVRYQLDATVTVVPLAELADAAADPASPHRLAD